MGTKAFRKIQIGTEATSGTAVAATAKLLGVLTMREELALVRPEYEMGRLSKYLDSTVAGRIARLQFQAPASFEQLGYFLLGGVKGSVTPAIDPDYVCVFTSPATYADYTDEATDDSSSTHVPLDSMADSGYLYIGASAPFQLIRVDMGSNVNDQAATLSAEYSKGSSSWESLTISDGTASSGKPFAQDGDITFTTPSDWATDTVDSQAGLYWVRFAVSATLAAAVDLNEVSIIETAANWDFDPNLTSNNSPNSFTLEYGDDTQAYESEYCIPSEIRLSGGVDAAVQMTVDMFGRQVSTCSFTGDLSDPSVEMILFNKAKLYIDDSGAGIGGTEKAATLISMDVRIPTGFTPQKYGDGNLYFGNIAEATRNIAVDLTFAFNATGVAERAAFAAQTKRFIRIAIEGSTISGPDKKFLYIDFCGRYTEDLLSLGERDGLDIVNARLESCYDPTWTKEFRIQLQNSVAAMP